MIPKDFWPKSTVTVIGAGSWGTTLACLVAPRAAEVRIWTRSEEQAREMNSNRVNRKYLPDLSLPPNIRVTSDLAKSLEGDIHCVIWALPSAVCRDVGKQFAGLMSGSELVIHATKGLETGTLKRVSQVLLEEFPTRRVGVISGPNLAHEIARGEPAAAVVASRFDDVLEAGLELFTGPKFRVYRSYDLTGVEWAGTLKNILAIAAGVLDALGLGLNARAMLISRGVAEMVRFGTAMGAEQSTFLGLAGIGDLLATCSSVESRNYRVGQGLGQGQHLDEVLTGIGRTAEGVRTTFAITEFARERKIEMPITQGVYRILKGESEPRQILDQLMSAAPTPVE